MKQNITKINKQLRGLDIHEVLDYFFLRYPKKIAQASSLSIEDQVLTDLILQKNKNIKIFTLDTGRLHEETYQVMNEINKKYQIKIDVYYPDYKNIQLLYKNQGINGFKESIENRKNCCQIRKIEPLKRALQGLDVWITGLRRSQSKTRENIQLVEWDESNSMIKLNPLVLWNEDQIWQYIKHNKIPYNKLYDIGYPSIGCEPCTRAIKDGEDIRSGRWWWEDPEHKECGLHLKKLS